MSHQKILEGLKRNIPIEVQLSDVLTVAKGFFDRVEEPRRGSHYKIYDHRFEHYIRLFPGEINFSYDGRFTFPVKKGKWVKKFWVERILRVIEIINSIEGKG